MLKKNPTNIWKLNNTFLNNLWVKEEIVREARKYFKQDDNETVFP